MDTLLRNGNSGELLFNNLQGNPKRILLTDPFAQMVCGCLYWLRDDPSYSRNRTILGERLEGNGVADAQFFELRSPILIVGQNRT